MDTPTSHSSWKTRVTLNKICPNFTTPWALKSCRCQAADTSQPRLLWTWTRREPCKPTQMCLWLWNGGDSSASTLVSSGSHRDTSQPRSHSASLTVSHKSGKLLFLDIRINIIRPHTPEGFWSSGGATWAWASHRLSLGPHPAVAALPTPSKENLPFGEAPS